MLFTLFACGYERILIGLTSTEYKCNDTRPKQARVDSSLDACCMVMMEHRALACASGNFC